MTRPHKYVFRDRGKYVLMECVAVEWSGQQQDALADIQSWLDAAHEGGQQVFRLFGYAGTGKSTLAKHIGALENDRGGYSQFAAFTGKAAVVMRRKGCQNARTIHSIIYQTKEKSAQRLKELEAELDKAKAAGDGRAIMDLELQLADERENVRQPGFALKPDPLRVVFSEDDSAKISLFVLDECSMIDATLGGDLQGLGIPILVMGDPAQLPPVMGTGFFTNAKPDALLTEIHRQALDSPIIDMANQVRQGSNLNLGSYGDGCAVIQLNELGPDERKALFMDADQILVGMNRTRDQINGRARELKGFAGYLPCVGEKLVCLNNHRETGLLNGSLWECLDAVDDTPGDDCFTLSVASLDDDGRKVECRAHKWTFMHTEAPTLPYDRMRAVAFDFGYALTVHKFQGSQADNVVVMDEWTRRDTRSQWLYTAITRAAKRVTVVRR